LRVSRWVWPRSGHIHRADRRKVHERIRSRNKACVGAALTIGDGAFSAPGVSIRRQRRLVPPDGARQVLLRTNLKWERYQGEAGSCGGEDYVSVVIPAHAATNKRRCDTR